MGGSKGSGNTTTTNEIPAELKGLTGQTAGKISGYQQYDPNFNISNYSGSHVQGVPGLAGNQRQAIGEAQNVGGMTPGEGYAYGALGDSPYYAGQSGQAKGGTLATDPSIAAAYQNYKSTVEPDLQSQFGLMGLGKSSLLGDALAKGAASQLQPATEQALAREQSANENRIGRQTSTALNQAGQYANLGSQELNRRLSSLQSLMQTGAMERGVGSEEEQAKQQDFLRQQALAEQGTFGVLGALPSSLGSQVASKTGSSGMFK